jgi:replication-associated recombination protein RarA
MSVNNLILWEKYRPNSAKKMVLLPRIESYIKDGINCNMIFYGTSGTGKTTLAKIIASEYNSLTLNGKLGIELLSQSIKNHFDSLNLMSKNKTKMIFIDEFDRATIQLQDGLKSFIEEYPNARFIFTTNHIDKITSELKSRFSCIPFDPINASERKYLLDKQTNYIRGIAKKEGYEDYNNIDLFTKIKDF